MYIKFSLNFNIRTDLILLKSKELESILIEVINSRKSNLIVRCLYHHPSMCPSEFINHHVNPLLEKVSLDNKKFMLIGDFNFDLLKYNTSNEV